MDKPPIQRFDCSGTMVPVDQQSITPGTAAWVRYDDVSQLEAHAYALEDQVRGLRELIDGNASHHFQRIFVEEAARVLIKKVLPDIVAQASGRPATARELQRALAKILSIREDDENDFGDPRHCHNVKGKWDKDGSDCESCAAWDQARALLKRGVFTAPLPPERPLRDPARQDSRVESCTRPEGCVCGGDVPAVRHGCSHFEWLTHRWLG